MKTTENYQELQNYPGNERHRALLQAVLRLYQNDPRILSVIVFGSLGRGSWDAYSDLDLDVIIADDTKIDVLAEVGRVCESFAGLGERAALIIPDNDDAADIVLESLMELSIRYHPLAGTDPFIIDSMRVLAGVLEPEAIAAAGKANPRHKPAPPPGQLLDECLRSAAVANGYLHRKRAWSTIEMLHSMRALLMEIYTRTHGGKRSSPFFEANASERLRTGLASALPQVELSSLREALLRTLDFIENDLEELGGGQLHLTDAQRTILTRVRQEVEALSSGWNIA